jgi:hypothetical protein
MRFLGVFCGFNGWQHLFAGPSRCFPFWQEVLACYVVNTTADDDSGKKKCSPVLEDYYECLHHKKEVGFDEQHNRNSIADGIACAIGYKDACDTTSIPKSRICRPSRRCAKGGGDTESGAFRQGWGYQGCAGQISKCVGLCGVCT